MKMSNKSWFYQPLLASTLAAAVFSGTSISDEPPVVSDKQVILLADDEGNEKETVVKAVKDEESDAPQYWLGIGLKEVTGDLAEYLGSDGGVMVADVFPDSPAAKADVKKGDILVSANGKQLAGPTSLLNVLKVLPQPKEGTAVEALEIVLLRKGKELTTQVTPTERPKEMIAKQSRADDSGDADYGVATIIGDLAGKTPEEIREWVEKRSSGKDGATFFRFGAPSAMWFGDGTGAQIEGNINAVIVSEDDGEKIEITIERKGDGPAKIKIKEGDVIKEYTQHQLGELPDKVQQLVRPMLQGGNRFQFRMRPLRGQTEGKEGAADKKEDGDGGKKSAENRNERRSRIAILDADVDLPDWFNEHEMSDHFRKMAEEWAKKYKDSAKWAQDAADMPAELKELREQVDKLRNEIQSLRAKLEESKK